MERIPVEVSIPRTLGYEKRMNKNGVFLLNTCNIQIKEGCDYE